MSSYLYRRGIDRPIPKLFATHVVFGSPSKKCLGSGICKLYTLHAQKRTNCPCAMVEAELVLAEFRLALLVPNQQVSAQHFEAPHFIMEEDFVLPTWLNKFGNGAARYIPAGAYSFLRINKSLYLEFPLLVQ